MPGNIIDLGANLTSLGLNSGAFELIYSEDLLGAMSAMPYVWGNRNTSIRLPMGVNETSVRYQRYSLINIDSAHLALDRCLAHH